MQVVHAVDPVDGGHGRGQLGDVESGRRGLEQDVSRLGHEPQGPTADDDGDEDRHDGIDPEVAVGEQDDGAGDGHPGVGGGIAHGIDEDGAHVEVLGVGPQDQGGDAVDQKGGHGDDDHQLAFDVMRLEEAANALHQDQDAHGEDAGGVGLGGEDRRSVVAEGALGRGRAPHQPHRHQRDAHHGDVGDRVPGGGEHPQRVGEEPDAHQAGHHGDVQAQHEPQASLPVHALHGRGIGAATTPAHGAGGRRFRSDAPPRGRRSSAPAQRLLARCGRWRRSWCGRS